MLNLEWFRTFKVVYEAGTLCAAAELLFISQPGVSLHLNSLESYTGFRLFERDSRKVSPTDRGKILYNYIIDAMIALEEIEQRVHKKSKTGRATLSVGMCYTTFQYVLEEHICGLPFNLITRYGEPSKMMEDLENGAVDFILTSKEAPRTNLIFKAFAQERLILICGSQTDCGPLDELISSGNKASLRKWLRKQKWFATSADMEYLKSFWSQNFKELPDFNPDYILPHYGSILRCLSGGSGFAVIPDFIYAKEVERCSIKKAWEGYQAIENTLFFATRNKPVYPKEIDYLENLLKKNWSEFKSMS